MAYWLFILGDYKAYEWVVKNSRMAFRDHIRADRIAKGDRFALYITRGAESNPTKNRAEVVATGTVVSERSRRKLRFEEDEFHQSFSVDLDAEPLPRGQAVDFRLLVPDLKFIRKKTSWFAYVRKSLTPIMSEDFAVLHKALEARRAELASE